jgi:tetratricopeptide (TPR) repeat protein
VTNSENLPTDDDQARPVFVSYATADRKEALAVCKAIERRGLKCWISTRDVEPGENYQEAIVRALRHSRAMVLVFSDAANNSNEIKKELSLASRYQVSVMALRIEDVEPSDAFAYELSTRQWIDAFESWDKSIDALVRKIEQVGGSTDAGASADARPVARRRASLRSPKPVLIGVAALALVAIAIAGWMLLRPGAVAAHTMQVRLAGFQRLSPDLPAAMPQSVAEEINAAFNDDGVIGVSTASAPPPGNAPAYALSGSIRHEGDKVKVITRLTNERSGSTLWTGSNSYDAANLAQVPRWAAVDASAVVRCGLFGASTYPKALTDQTLTHYLQFCSEPSPTKSLDSAHKVVAAAPDFSWGWSAVGAAGLAAMFGEDPGPKREQLRQQAIDAFDKAIRLDPSNSEAYSNKSYLLAPTDLVGREALLKQGIGARPLACGCEHHLYGNFLLDVGRVKDAVDEFRRAIDVLPLNGASQIALGDALIIRGYPEQSKQPYDAAVDLVDNPQLREVIDVMSAPLTGKYSGLDAAVHDRKIGVPAAVAKAVADSFAAMQSGSAPAKAAAAAELVALPPEMTGRLSVTLLGALGANRDALAQVELRAQRSSPDAASLLFYPSMRGAMRDPGFPAVAQRLGLMHYWKTTHTRPDVCSDKDAPPFCRMI